MAENPNQNCSYCFDRNDKSIQALTESMKEIFLKTTPMLEKLGKAT